VNAKRKRTKLNPANSGVATEGNSEGQKVKSKKCHDSLSTTTLQLDAQTHQQIPQTDMMYYYYLPYLQMLVQVPYPPYFPAQA
jgi:hypothetical protein